MYLVYPRELIEGPATKSGLRNPPIENIVMGRAYPAELINADSTSQTNKAIAGWKKGSVAWGIGV